MCYVINRIWNAACSPTQTKPLIAVYAAKFGRFRASVLKRVSVAVFVICSVCSARSSSSDRRHKPNSDDAPMFPWTWEAGHSSCSSQLSTRRRALFIAEHGALLGRRRNRRRPENNPEHVQMRTPKGHLTAVNAARWRSTMKLGHLGQKINILVYVNEIVLYIPSTRLPQKV